MSGNGGGSSSTGGDKKYDPYIDPGERQEDLADLLLASLLAVRCRSIRQKEEKEREEEEKKQYDSKDLTFRAASSSLERRRKK